MDYTKMKILFQIFLLVISNSIPVQSDDNVAMESNVGYQETYKVHPDPEDVGHLNDRQTEGYHSVVQTFGKGVESPLKEYHDGRPNQIQGTVEKLHYSGETSLNDGRYSQEGQNIQLVTHQKAITYLPNDISQKSPEGLQHPIYIQQYPSHQLHIFGAEASPLHQINENGPHNQKTLGYSSFVEHVTEKDEEEIKSALKEGSVGDLKRLIPKSGISFKIYQKEKPGNLHLGGQTTGTESTVQPLKENVQELTHKSNLHHRIKVEVPEVSLKIQGVQFQQPKEPQIYLENHIGDQHLENTQKSFQAVGQVSHVQQQHGNHQAVYYSQSQEHPHKPLVELNGKGIPPSHFQIKVQDEVFNKPTSTIEFNRNVNSLGATKLTKPKKGFSQGVTKSHYRQWNAAGKNEGLQKTVKQLSLPVKPVQTVQYQIEPLAQVEGAKGVQNGFIHHTTTAGNNFAGHLSTNSYLESGGVKGDLNNFVSHSQLSLDAGKAGQNGLSSHAAYVDAVKTSQHDLVNRLSGNLYVNHEEQNHLLGSGSYLESQAPKSSLGHLTANTYSDSEAAKSNQYSIVSQVATNSYVDTKTSQNNFDHQKALEGSTSFDIKNAIGSTETHQGAGYISPTTEIHPVEQLGKHQLTYVIPKIPTSTVLISDGVHESTGVEGHHQVKQLSYSPQFYHTLSSPVVSEVSGKYFHQTPTISGWSPDQLKQGNVLTTNDLHHSVLRLHLPKEELHQIKSQNIELPTSFISQNIFPHHKQPIGVLNGKFSPEFNFQPKKNLQVQNLRVKQVPQLAIDWSLFKGQYPNVNINSIQVKPELLTFAQESGKKIVPILVRKRKNRSNKDTGVVYGKVVNNRRPKQPNQRNEKTLQFHQQPEASNTINHYSGKGDRKNEFSVSASYKVDRSFKNSDSS